MCTLYTITLLDSPILISNPDRNACSLLAVAVLVACEVIDHDQCPIQVPNAAHKAIAEFEAKLDQQQRTVTVVTQNTDMLHHRAGSRNVLEMFGKLNLS